MSSYAFSDLERKKIIFANQCTINDKYEKFYCENPICNAKLTLRSLNSPIRGRCVFLKIYHQIDNFISKIETFRY